MGEDREVPLLAGEPLERARATALFLYEAVFDYFMDPAVYERLYGGPGGIYKFLQSFARLVAQARPEYGRPDINITPDGNLELSFSEQGPESHELEELLSCVQ